MRGGKEGRAVGLVGIPAATAAADRLCRQPAHAQLPPPVS